MIHTKLKVSLYTHEQSCHGIFSHVCLSVHIHRSLYEDLLIKRPIHRSLYECDTSTGLHIRNYESAMHE